MQLLEQVACVVVHRFLAQRPDLEIKWIRGNIDTRLEKLKTEEYDAIILAAAGFARMGWKQEVVTEFLDETLCVPAVGQGALSIECRADDVDLLAQLQKLTCEKTKTAVEAERAFLDQMEGGCQVPIAGFAVVKEEGEVVLTALVASPDGKVMYKEEVSGTNPEQVGQEAAKLISEKGGKQLIDSVKEELNQ